MAENNPKPKRGKRKAESPPVTEWQDYEQGESDLVCEETFTTPNDDTDIELAVERMNTAKTARRNLFTKPVEPNTIEEVFWWQSEDGGFKMTALHLIYGTGYEDNEDVETWLRTFGVIVQVGSHEGCKMLRMHTHALIKVPVRMVQGQYILPYKYNLIFRKYFETFGDTGACATCNGLSINGISSVCNALKADETRCSRKITIVKIKDRSHFDACIQYIRRRAGEHPVQLRIQRRKVISCNRHGRNIHPLCFQCTAYAADQTYDVDTDAIENHLRV